MESGTYDHRFGGMARLMGDAKAEKLKQSHVCVVGIGGVGSWAVEALARSGVGRLTLIDWDDICYTNMNRQVHAIDGTVGRSKVEVMADRARSINPDIEVNAVRDFFTGDNWKELLEPGYDALIDAIDKLTPKCWLIAGCRWKKIPVVTVGAAGGMVDPSRIIVADLNRSHSDPLLAQVRTKLKKDFDFSRNPKARFKVECVFSNEPKVFPRGDGTVCPMAEANREGADLGCDFGYGSATFVTGSFAFAAVARVMRRLTLHL